jgi:diguanylate cyclase (GGDEF)-like protein/PAS domain S-box-containing protein
MLLALGGYSLRYRNSRSALVFGSVLVLAAIWALAYGLDILSGEITTKLIWTKVRLSVYPLLPVAMLVTSAEFSRRVPWLSKRAWLSMLIIPAINLLIIWDKALFPWLHPTTWIPADVPYPALQGNNGPWMILIFIFGLAINFISLGILFATLQNSQGTFRCQALLLTCGYLVPILFDASYGIAQISPIPGYNFAPNLFLLTGALGGFALFQKQPHSTTPSARSLAVDKMSDLMLVIDPENRIVDLNQAARDFFVLPAEDQPVEKFVPQWSEYKTRLATQNPWQGETQIMKHGEPVAFKVTINQVEDPLWQSAGYLLILCEFTARNESHQRLLQLSQTMSNGLTSIVITDPQGVIVYTDARFSELTGYSLAEAQGQKMSLLKSGETPAETYQTLWKTIENGNVWRGEILNRRKSGELYWEETFISPVLDVEGQISNYIAIKEDITERKKTDDELKKRLKELEIINTVSIAAASQLDLDSLVNLVGAKLEDIFNVRSVLLTLYEKESGLIRSLYWTIDRQQMPATTLEYGRGLTTHVLQTGQPLLVDDDFLQRGQEMGAVKFVVEHGSPKTWLGVPMMVGGEAIGVISVQDYEKEHAFKESDIRLLQIIGINIGIAIQNARLYASAQKEIAERTHAEAETRHRADELSTLYDIALTLTSNLEFNQVLHILFERCRQVLPMDAFYVGLYEEESHIISHPLFFDHGTFKQVAARDLRITPGLTGEIIEDQKTLYLPDIATEEINPKYQIVHLGGIPSRSYVGVPMLIAGRAIGVLSMQSSAVNAYSPAQIRLLETIAAIAGVAIENSRLFEQAQAEIQQRREAQELLLKTNADLQTQLEKVKALQQELREQATRDPLTGLYNRRYLTETLQQRLAEARRKNKPLSALMIDIDHFKTFNDTYGHHVGDVLLQTLAEILRSRSRTSDIACRYGGEEFLLILADAPLEIASRRAEELRMAFAETTIPSGSMHLHITISIGIAVFPEHGKTMEALIIQADQALYAAKSAGRNRVVTWQK